MKLILFIFCVTFSSFCFSQDYLFLKNGTEIYGSVLYINKAKVYFEDADTGDRKWHKKIEKLIDNVNENTIEYKVRDIDGLSSYLSGELVSGKASYYRIHKHVAGGQGYLSFYYIYKEGDKKAFKDLPNSLTTPFHKRLSKYFSDCPTLSKKIKSKVYNYSDTEEIIKFYNTNCAD